MFTTVLKISKNCNGSDSHKLLTQKAWVLSQSNPRGFIVNRVAMGQVFLRVLQFTPLSIVPPILYTHSFVEFRRQQQLRALLNNPYLKFKHAQHGN
jgi:hypothetical protein